jgi:hypothetical protein
LRTLRLWQKFINLLDETAVAGRQSARGHTEANAGDQCDGS